MKKRTTVYLDVELLKEAKMKMLREGGEVSFSVLLDTLLQEYLQDGEEITTPSPKPVQEFGRRLEPVKPQSPKQDFVPNRWLWENNE